MNIQEVKSRLNPANPNHAMFAKMLGNIQVMRGQDGKTPVKGVDYFTTAEIEEILKIVDAKIRTFERGLKGEKGARGEQGLPGLNGRHGRDGYTPVKGKDYFTNEDINEIVFKTLLKIKVPKDGISPKMADIVNAVLKEIKLPERDDIVSKKELVEFLRRGGFRGGGDTISAGTGITITEINGIKQISTNGSAALSILTATGTVDDSNVTFTFASVPVLININGSFYAAGSTVGGVAVWTNVGTTITLAFPVGTGGCIFGL